MLAVILAGVLVAGACGDSDDAEGGAGTTEPSADAKPIKVMVIATVSSPALAFPEGAAAIRGRFEVVNDGGGINGRKVEVEVCNDENDPNAASACARDAVAGSYDAVIGYFSVHGRLINPVLEQAGIPNIGLSLVTPDDFVAPVGFALDGIAPQPAIAFHLARTGKCKTIAHVTGNNPAQLQSGQITVAAVKKGGAEAFLVAVPATTPDYAPFIADAIRRGADCLSSGVAAQEYVKFLTAAKQARREITTSTSLNSITEESLKALGDLAEGTWVASPWQYSDAVRKQIETEMRAVDSNAKFSDFAVRGWTAAWVLTEVAKNLDEVDAGALFEALSSTSSLSVPTGPTLDFTAEGPSPDYARLFNTKFFVLQVRDGKVVPAAEDPVDIGPVLASL